MSAPRSLLFIFFALTIYTLRGQPSLKFHHINTKKGLSQDHVLAVLRDSRGFMWFATAGGLNKYDGYEFTVFRHNPDDKNSISDNFVNDIVEDKNGNLLVALNTGLEILDRSKNHFTHYDIKGYSVRDIFEDSRGNLWLGTNNGVFKFHLEKGILLHLESDKSNPNSISDNLIYEITEDNDRNLWIASRNGVTKVDSTSASFTRFFHDPKNPNSISGNITRAIFKDRSGAIWVGTRNSGVSRIQPDHKTIINYRHDPNKNSLCHNDILCFSEDDKGNIWIGTENGGVDLFDPNTSQFTNYTTQKGDDRSLSNPSVHTLHFDKTQNMWIGTYAGGVDLIPKFGDKFEHYRQNTEQTNSLSSSNVLSLNGDRDGIVWIGTDGSGLNRFDPVTKSFKQFYHNEKDKASIASNYVFSITDFDSQTLLITYYRAGFDFMDKKTGRCSRFELKNEGPLDIATTTIINGFRENDTDLWLATASLGLIKFNLKTKSYKHYAPHATNKDAISGDAVHTIMKDHLGNLWFGTSGGLCLYNKQEDKFSRFEHVKEDNTSLSHSSVYCIFEDSRKNLWIGTANGGLNLFDYKTKTFQSFTEKDGLANNSIFAIQEDVQGNLWLSTNKGLTRFSTSTHAVRNYDAADGVQGNQFRFNASCRASDGKLYFGGTNGFNAFYPETVSDNTVAPPIKITGFEIFNKPVDPSPNSPLKEVIDEAETIVLPYDQSVFTFKFSALNYNVPEKNQYAYRLIGFDKDWNEIGTKRTVTYTNLDPSSYQFIVRGCNNDGVWNNEGTSIMLIIKPPFWMTWWFRTLIFISLLLALFAVYKIRVRNIEKQKRDLEFQVSERTREIIAQKEEIESQKESIEEKNTMLEKQYHEIAAKNEKIVMQRNKIEEARNEIKLKNDELLRYNSDLESMVQKKTSQLEKTFEILKESNRELDLFIYRSAHDLKGPIASILGLCNLGTLETKDPKMIDLLSKMEFSAEMMTKKLTRLMKIHEINTLHVKLQNIDSKILINEIISEIHQELDCTNIKINIEANHTALNTDKELLKILLKNVIENSIKYKDERKKNHYVTIRVYDEDEKTIFSIVDNGIGIPKQEANRVFDLFVVATDHIKGFGIGLYESKVIARKLNGDIELNYPPTGETEFRIALVTTGQSEKVVA